MTTYSEPIILWQPAPTTLEPTPKAVRVLAPEVELAKYTFSYNPETFEAVGTTPSMTLTSMSLTSEFYQEELAALQTWYGDSVVMEKYASGVTRTDEQTKKRYEQLAERWTAGFPYSGLMARNAAGELVAMFNLGYAVDDAGNFIANAAEFAGVVNPYHWNKGLASEAMIFMLVGVDSLSENKHGIEKNTPLEYVTAPARYDNWAANRVLQKSALTFMHQKELDGGTRNVYEVSVAEIKDILVNTERSRNEEGTFLPVLRAKL